MKFKTKLIFMITLLMGFNSLELLAASTDGAIKYRKALMSAVKGNADAMVQILTKGVEGQEAALKDIADAMAKASKSSTLIAAFEENTHNQSSKETTTATAKVWADWQDFSEAFVRMEAAAKSVADQAAAGTLTMKEMKSELFKECGYCHRKAGYRTKK